MVQVGVQLGGFDVQGDPPAPGVVGDRGKEDLRPILGQHAPQPAGVVMHTDLADTGQSDRPRPVVIADADGRRAALGVLVAQPKRRHSTGFLLEAWKPNPLAFAFART
jgi:hypothetical protein